MKKRSLFWGLIFAILSFAANGQAVVLYQQGFESSGETHSYTTQGSAAAQTALHVGGSRAIKLTYSSSNASFTTDTIDASVNGSFMNLSIEFASICNANIGDAADVNLVGVIQYKLVGSSTWSILPSSSYDTVWGGGSRWFQQTGVFSNRCYEVWQEPASSDSWKKERFNAFSAILASVDRADRKFQLRFVMGSHSAGVNPNNTGWYIDDLKVTASATALVSPSLTMVNYPQSELYPNSRDARFEIRTTTSSLSGLDNDSIYLLYKVGNRSTINKVRLTAVTGVPNHFRGYVPFYGYDTIIHYRVVVKDASLNHCEATFPMGNDNWNTYRHTRGYGNSVQVSTASATNETLMFPNASQHVAQFIYSKDEMLAAGYKAGAMTAMQFTISNAFAASAARDRCAIYLKNMPDDYHLSYNHNDDGLIYSNPMIAVYDAPLTINQNANTVVTINFLDTFYYAGGTLLMKIMNENASNNPAAVRVKSTPPLSPLDKSVYASEIFENDMESPFTGTAFQSGTAVNSQPNITFRAVDNLPLIYDAGVSGFVYPNDSVPAVVGVASNVRVTLKNMGASPINGIRLWYQVDNDNPVYYDWSGTLASFAETTVSFPTSQNYTAGYHILKSWVDDSIQVGTQRYRDHEPFNDTSTTRFVACSGPMSGVINVGGAGAEYANLDQFLFALAQCGVNGRLTVKLAAGTYYPTTFPAVPGSSPANYIQFEPATATAVVQFMPQTSNVNNLVYLPSAKHIRFKNIKFTATSDQRVTYFARFGINSSDCQFIGCTFREETGSATVANTFTSSLIYSGGADSLVVDSCSFYRGTVAVNMVGPAIDNPARANRTVRSYFNRQKNNAVVVRNQIAAVIDSNTIDPVTSNASYLILVQDCSGAMKITRNSVLSTSGAACLGVTHLYGTAAQPAIIANNMLSSDDDATSNMLVTPMNIIGASHTKAIFNTIRLYAPTRSDVAAATLGGDTIDQCEFRNNIVVCADTSNFAFSYVPVTGYTNTISHNLYYSRSVILNKYNGFNCTNFSSWQSFYADPNSKNVDPVFMLTTPTDLRSYNQNIKGQALPMPEVTDDIYGVTRSATEPCIGAFEFSSLPYDFEVTEMLEPYDEYCNVPASAPLKVVIRNTGVSTYDPATSGPMTLSYTRNSRPGILSPTNSGSVVVNRMIPGNDTIIFNTGRTVSFLVSGQQDTTYTFTMWLTSTVDPNRANDTSSFPVLAHYSEQIPDSMTLNTPYSTTVTATVSRYINTWYPYVFRSGRSVKSHVYWFTSPTSTTPFHEGTSFTTPILYRDTTFYVRQKRDLPLMKITEVQIARTGAGVTSPLPFWMHAQTTLAVELTNVGDYPASLGGDSLSFIIKNNNGSLNKRYFVFPNVTVDPGKNIVIQYRSNIGTGFDSTQTLPTTGLNLSVAYNNNFVVYYHDGTGIVDAVPFNSIMTDTIWTNRHFPAQMWNGAAISLPNGTAGAYRKGWPAATASPTAVSSVQYWQVADSSHSMSIGKTSPELILFNDNGCMGDVGRVNVHITSIPQVDIALDSFNISSGCGLGVEPIQVHISNYGVQASGAFVVHYALNGVTMCTDTVSAGLNGNAALVHTFSQPANLTVASGASTFNLHAWVDHLATDNSIHNDTLSNSVVSIYTPGMVNISDTFTVNYATNAMLQPNGTTSDSLVWFDSAMTPLDTTSVFNTGVIYADATYYVAGLGRRPTEVHVGNLANRSTNNFYPSPYNPFYRYAREQYIFTAAELIAAGHSAGPITGLSFYLDSMRTQTGSAQFRNYKIAIGATANTTFTSNNNWQPINQVYYRDTLTISNSDRNWITHTFDTPFNWDGVSNVVVDVSHIMTTNSTLGAEIRYTPSVANSALYRADNASTSIATYSGNGTRSANRPDIRFTFQDYACQGPTHPVYVHVVGIPAMDASVEWLDSVSYSSCGLSNIEVKVSNHGGGVVSAYTIDYWIDTAHGVYTGTSPIASNATDTVIIASYYFTPGHHNMRVAVTAVGDSVSLNDTITMQNLPVRFCAGTYYVGAADTCDYHTFTQALDALYEAGIAGPVVFAVQNGVYNEQLTVGSVDGVSATNTITFRSQTGDSAGVTLRYAPTNVNNFVLMFNNAAYFNFEHITILSRSASTFSNAVHMVNSHHLHFTSDVVRVKGTINNINASCMIIGENVQYVYLDSCTLDSGYYSIRSMVGVVDTTYGIYLNDNVFRNFQFQGVYLRKINEIYVRHNYIRSGVNYNGRALTGIFLGEPSGTVSVERNEIILSDSRNGGKRGIQLTRFTGTHTLRGAIYNNLISLYSAGVAGNISSGIYVDSSSYVNVFYNTARVKVTTASRGTMAMAVRSNSTNVFVQNNIFDNQCDGYAMYAERADNINTSDYNVYYSTSLLTSDSLLVFYGVNAPTIDSLRILSHNDINSMCERPYFMSDEDARLVIGQFCDMAQYNTSVRTDIDGKIRPQIPKPCIGGHEPAQPAHDIVLMEVLEPTLSSDNVESDQLKVVVHIYNNGSSTESNLLWHAEVVGRNLRSPDVQIAELEPHAHLIDTTYIAMPLGIIDTQRLHVELLLSNDVKPEDNVIDTSFFLHIAYNLRAVSVEATTGDGCRLYETPIAITLTNIGRKAFPTNLPINIGYQAIVGTNGITVPQLPLVHTEQATLAAPLDTNASVTFNFVTPANLYPTNNATDITVRLRGWSTYEHDQKHQNDTTAYVNVTSKHTPSMPQVADLHIPYGTWDTIFASQTDVTPTGVTVHRPIRWYRDSTREDEFNPFFANTNYNRSTWWETPQYFHDSVYYLSCISTTGCTSYFKPVSVYLNPRVATDVAVSAIKEPYSKVFMDNDTVKVYISNYGTQSVSNIPVVYQFRRNNSLIQQVREVCTATIQPGDFYLFKFDSLVSTPITNVDYGIKVWTDVSNDQVRSNDTLRGIYTFRSLTDDAYCTPTVNAANGLDLTWVSYSGLEHHVSPMSKDYFNFANRNNPAAGVLRLTKGTVDTLIVECTNSDDYSDDASDAILSVLIDYNRDGRFEPREIVYSDTIRPLNPAKIVYTYPYELIDSLHHLLWLESRGRDLRYPLDKVIEFSDSALTSSIHTETWTPCLGYMRMRVVVELGSFPLFDGVEDTATGRTMFNQQYTWFDRLNWNDGDNDYSCTDITYGQIQDYLLYVEDSPAPVDAQLSRFVSPINRSIEEDSTEITVLVSNKGATPITGATIGYAYIDRGPYDRTAIGTFQWTGNIQPGESQPVTLPKRHLREGPTEVRVSVTVDGDENSSNDTLYYEYNRFYTVRLVLDDNFESLDKWYAPKGYNVYSENVWERGVPHKTTIPYAHSDSTVWATRLNQVIQYGGTGNLSFLYTPFIDISQVRPDTLTFWLNTSFNDSITFVKVQYFNYLGKWVDLGSGNDTLWYNSGSGFIGSSNGTYVKYTFPTSHVQGDLQQRLQFRFVFHANPGGSRCDGCALDDIIIGHAQRAVDVGVTQILYPTEPKFGQTIRPRVVITNFGSEPAHSVTLAYSVYGQHLPRVGTYDYPEGIPANGGTALFTFPDPFIVRNDFPDTFQMCVYTTVNSDIYWENDSICQDFALSPLDNDMAMTEFLYPLDRVVAGDSMQITTRLRNYGASPVSEAQVTYVFNNRYTVTETVNFQELLGRDLESFEYFNYTFHRKCRASMGNMHLQAFIEFQGDDYLFNDTINKSVVGISAVTDLRASGIVVDTATLSRVQIQLTVDNIGARLANDFELGFWIDNDTTTMYRTRFNRPNEPLAALHTLYFFFDTVLPQRAAGYHYVTGFVHIDGDNDPTNDTTSLIVSQYRDIRPIRLLVEENRGETCRVRLEIENIGNTTYHKPLNVTSIINGQTIRMSYDELVVEPGRIVTLDLPRTIPKNASRSYVGSAEFTHAPSDGNTDNNITSQIDVVNYFGIPTVDAVEGMSLEQNYPNPFTSTTRVDFSIPQSGDVRFFVMDAMGRLVYQKTEFFDAGTNSVTYDGSHLPTGTYYYGIEHNGSRLMRKMVFKH